MIENPCPPPPSIFPLMEGSKHIIDNIMKKKFVVIKSHISEYPDPIHFSAGDLLVVGEKYAGNEGWDNWYFCSFNGLSGWVPKQLIEIASENTGVAKENYSASELNVEVQEYVIGFKKINGWIWCEKLSTEAQGWFPELNLKEI